MTCTVYVALVWNIIYWMIMIIIIIIINNNDNNNDNNNNNNNNNNDDDNDNKNDNNDNNNNNNHNNNHNNNDNNNNTDASGCFFTNVTFTAVAEISIRGFLFKSYHKFIEFNLFCIHLILFWIDELIHLYSIYLSGMNIEFHLWYENYRRHFQIYLQWRCLNFNYNFTEVCSQGSNWL